MKRVPMPVMLTVLVVVLGGCIVTQRSTEDLVAAMSRMVGHVDATVASLPLEHLNSRRIYPPVSCAGGPLRTGVASRASMLVTGHLDHRPVEAGALLDATARELEQQGLEIRRLPVAQDGTHTLEATDADDAYAIGLFITPDLGRFMIEGATGCHELPADLDEPDGRLGRFFEQVDPDGERFARRNG